MFQNLKRILERNQVKIIQYVMVATLFLLAFMLPGYGLRRQQAESAASLEETRTEQARTGDAQTGYAQAGKGQTQATGTGDGRTQAAGTSENSAAGKGTIVVDPGHGGSDPGMVGSTGISEKVLNLVYGKKLAALLEQEGYRVVMTRTTEDGLYDEGESNQKAQDMQRRCALIEQEKPLVTVSIHQNSYPDASVCGPQVFYYEHSAEGEKLAAMIQDCMNEQLEIARPRVHKANGSYYILKRSASTTALVEFGFLTNPKEEVKLQDEAYQDRAVQAVCDGVLKYLQTLEE